MKQAFTLLILLMAMVSAGADDAVEPPPPLGPINADPLTVRGISPRVLDVCIATLSQGPSWVMRVEQTETIGDDAPITQRARLTYDATTHFGIDLWIEFENDPMRAKRVYKKQLSRYLGTEYWVRGQDRLYDPDSLEVVSANGDDAVISFRYDRARIPMNLRWTKNLAGKVFIEDGVLDRIELEAERPFSWYGVKISSYTDIISFGKVADRGGYLIDRYRGRYEGTRKGRPITMEIVGQMLSYTDENDRPIEWQTRSAIPADLPEYREKIQLNLERTLPIWANNVRKMGFQLPKTYGIGVIGHWQETLMDIKGLQVANIDVSGGDLSWIDPVGSEIFNATSTMQVRGDVWILPFLNVSLMAGTFENQSDITLRFTPQGRLAILALFGQQVPEVAEFPNKTTGSTIGGGLGTGGQYENLFFALNWNYTRAITNETNSEIDAMVTVGLVGYDFGDIGLRLMAGIEYLDLDQTIHGEVPTGDPANPLEFTIDVGIATTQFIAGVYKEFGPRWNIAGLVGAGAQKTKRITFQAGYRF